MPTPMFSFSFVPLCALLLASFQARAQEPPPLPDAVAPVVDPTVVDPTDVVRAAGATEAASAPVSSVAVADVLPGTKDPELFGYDDGFFLTAPDGLSKLRVRGLVQPRFSLVAEPSAANTPAASPGDVANASFAVQRAQIELLGHILTKDVTFDLKTEFGRGAAFIKDAYLEAKVVDGVFVRGGLYKRPFQRQQMASDWKLAFFERNLTEETFKGGRDIGLSAHNGIDKGPTVEWSLGVYSGASDKPTVTGDVIPHGAEPGELDDVQISNVPRLMKPTVVGRVGFNSSKDLKPYSEVDFEGGGFRFGTSLSTFESVDMNDEAATTRFCLDGIAKVAHVTMTGAVLLSMANADGDDLVAQSADGYGAFAQAGWLLFDLVQPAVRYSFVNNIADDEIEHEIVGNVTLFFFGQNLLWGVEGGSNVVNGVPDVRVRTQAQLAF